MNIDISFHPLVSVFYIGIVLAAFLWVTFVCFRRHMFDLAARAVMLLILLFILFNPSVVRETRQYQDDKLVLVLDKSASMNVAERATLRDAAVAKVKERFKDNQIITLDAGNNGFSSSRNQTEIFTTLKSGLLAMPIDRIAGTVIVSDGRVHDVPSDIAAFKGVMPINALIVGNKDEFDYKLDEPEAPRYGLVGETVKVKIKPGYDGPKISEKTLTLKVEYDGKVMFEQEVLAGEENEFQFKLEHAGQNIFEFSIDGDDKELTKINNRQAVIVNGIRDRLKVLLVSGKPHMGERAWRNLLRSDPAVDLVHFTILRTPDAFDPTPGNQLSLIAFPVEELFSQRIEDFDLIIFDKYVHYGLLYDRYFTNIANYVRNGGSFLMAMGSDRLEPEIFSSDLAGILPISSNLAEQQVLQGDYMPHFAASGAKHSITSSLKTDVEGMTKWKSQIGVRATSGEVLLNGINNNPLLIVDNVGRGRVAVLTSDNIWLWAKKSETQAQYFDLQRKLAHWLMKEPELEKGYIKVTPKAESINVAQRPSDKPQTIMNVIYPDGGKGSLDLQDGGDGWNEASMPLLQKGLYKFYNDGGSTVMAIGYGGGREFVDMTATDKALGVVAAESGGNVKWFDGKNGSDASGLIFKSKHAYSVTGMERINLFSNWVYIVLIFLGFLYVWRRESRN